MSKLTEVRRQSTPPKKKKPRFIELAGSPRGSKDKRIMKHTDLKINLSQCLLSPIDGDEYVRI